MITLGLSEKEMVCRCCGRGYLTFFTLLRYTLLRMHLGVALTIASAFRCPKHNKYVGGSPKSRHMDGEALDIEIPKGMTKKEFADICGWFFSTVLKGYTHPETKAWVEYQTIVHCDTRTDSKMLRRK